MSSAAEIKGPLISGILASSDAAEHEIAVRMVSALTGQALGLPPRLAANSATRALAAMLVIWTKPHHNARGLVECAAHMERFAAWIRAQQESGPPAGTVLQ